MTEKKQIEIFRPMGGDLLTVGWLRDDLKGVAHGLGRARAGEMFQPSDGFGGPHWPCEVCDAHNYTPADFDQQMRELSADAVPDRSRIDPLRGSKAEAATERAYRKWEDKTSPRPKKGRS